MPYVERVHELDALFVLAQVVRSAHEAGVDASNISAFLLALPPELRHPVDRRPPVWAEGVLAFAPETGARIEPRLALALPTAP